MERERKKIVHTLDTPFSAVQWPQISQEDQDTILELLCRLLAPLGQHRRSFVTPSKGKRKRRSQKQANPEKPDEAQSTPQAATEPEAPPAPELAAYVDVGLAKVSRHLQEMSSPASSSKPAEPPTSQSAKDAEGAGPEAPKASPPEPGQGPYAIVFVARSGQSSAFHCHFPQMVASASKSLPADSQAVRLVGFSKACEDRLSAALGIPRASSIALREGAPLAKGLVDFVREHVRPVEAKWLEETRAGNYLETKIQAVPTKVGNSRKRKTPA
ncbi:hypothetical protein QBC46DRAFT_393150 [Diplogelasinospora grovesii]|uniref:Uncharacterized protein n=1 Tax=Diplogelasinospora grovesii TaxID=303347 RepID=A0AAN6S1Q1_9PEZI|nr:hypothetical protein QBC46DRAFT_393150 [Diplogelasinospora grovesii]